jgi:hypothetical protein
MSKNTIANFNIFNGFYAIFRNNLLPFQKTSENRVNPDLVTGLLKLRPAVAYPVIGDCGPVHVQFVDSVCKVSGLLGPVKK